MKFIVTGGCGFIGSNLVKYLVEELNHEVVNIDNLSYASNQHFLSDISGNKKYKFFQADILNYDEMIKIFNSHSPDKIMHLAAETHVDRSIDTPDRFIETNFIGTYNLLKVSLEYYKNLSDKKKKQFTFHHISTDEVFGDLEDNQTLFHEETRYDPSSPYSASKAGSDHLVNAWNRTYGLPTLISNCSNNYGPNQYAEKLIPLIFFRAINLEPLPVYGDGSQIRDWLYVEDHVKALVNITLKSEVNEYYNIGGKSEMSNIEVVKKICSILDKLYPSSSISSYSELIQFVEDRPGHDKRYAINTNKIEKKLGWYPIETFETGIYKTIQWYLDNKNLYLDSDKFISMTKRRGKKK